MTNNPLFPSSSNSNDHDANAAADLIRQKLTNIYGTEPDAQQELAETEAATRPLSKHQQYMHQLNTSGKTLAQIQTDWHVYYAGLPDNEKHEVWQEFYASNNQGVAAAVQQQPKHEVIKPAHPQITKHDNGAVVAAHHVSPPAQRPRKRLRDTRSVTDVKDHIRDTVTAGGKLNAKHHFQSLAFGIGCGLLIILVTLFGFFNEVVVAPFIQPNSHVAATPVILDPNNITVGSTPEVIIPKINVEIPVDYSQTTTEESQIENALDSGVVHYPTTALPGQVGNTAIFGHSSNNIFNPGKYKFAFVLLHELVEGDNFYLTKDGKAYVYKVISRTVVDPSEVGVLNPVAGQTATATLITCDPPGTSLKRLVVVGQQISPDPSGNGASTAQTVTSSDTTTNDLPGNGPTLWSRFWKWLF